MWHTFDPSKEDWSVKNEFGLLREIRENAIESLTWSPNNLMEIRNLNDLTEALLTNKSLKTVSCVHLNFGTRRVDVSTTKYLVAILEGLVSHPRLNELKFVSCKFEQEAGKCLVDVLKASTSIERLDFETCDIQDKDILLNALKSNSSITDLRITGEGVEMDLVIKWVPESTILRKISLIHPYLEGFKPSIEEMLLKNTSLTGLDFSFCNISPHSPVKFLQILCQGVQEHPNICELSLSSNQIGPRGAEIIASSLNSMNLKRLDLEYCEIDDQGMIKLARALQENTTLTALKLCTRPSGDTGLEAILKTVSKSIYMQSLSVSIGGRRGGLCTLPSKFLSDFVGSNPLLSSLTVRCEDHRVLGVKALFFDMEMLRINTNLIHLTTYKDLATQGEYATILQRNALIQGCQKRISSQFYQMYKVMSRVQDVLFKFREC